MEIEVKNLINIFTIINGEIFLLVKNNKLIEVVCNDDLNNVNNEYIKNNLIINNLNLKQCYTFSRKEENKLILTILYVDIININSIELNTDFKFAKLDDIRDNNIYLDKSIEYLRENLILCSTIKKIYPDEFILPEIQKIYEKILNKKIDRRNFRKKLIKLDIIEDLDKINSSRTGRPAKLYKFKDITQEKILF